MIYHRLLVLAALYGPADLGSLQDQDVSSESMAALREVADVLGMWPLEENTWVWKTSDFDWCKKRIKQLPFPPSADAFRFVSLNQAEAMVLRFRQEQGALDIARGFWWDQEAWENSYAYVVAATRAWSRIEMAHKEPLKARAALAELRELIGPEAYYAGRLPLPKMQPVTLP